MTDQTTRNFPPTDWVARTDRPVVEARTLTTDDLGGVIRFHTPHLCPAQKSTLTLDAEITGTLVGLTLTRDFVAVQINHDGEGGHWFELNPAEWVLRMQRGTPGGHTHSLDLGAYDYAAGVPAKDVEEPVGEIRDGLISAEPAGGEDSLASSFVDVDGRNLRPGIYKLRTDGDLSPEPTGSFPYDAAITRDGVFRVRRMGYSGAGRQPYEPVDDWRPIVAADARKWLAEGKWRVVLADDLPDDSFRPEPEETGDRPEPEPAASCTVDGPDGVTCVLPDGHEGFHVANVTPEELSDVPEEFRGIIAGAVEQALRTIAEATGTDVQGSPEV